MTFLHSMVSFPMGWVVAAAIVVASLLGLWISTLLSRKWYVTIKRSDETELMVHFLRRIAEALERLAEERESQGPNGTNTETSRPIGIPTLGR